MNIVSARQLFGVSGQTSNMPISIRAHAYDDRGTVFKLPEKALALYRYQKFQTLDHYIVFGKLRVLLHVLCTSAI